MDYSQLYDKISQAIDNYIVNKNLDLFTEELKSEMETLWLEYAEEENDWRSGEETYGYIDKESIENNIFYISDRWGCAFRLRWILDGLYKGVF